MLNAVVPVPRRATGVEDALKGKVICGECGSRYERILDNRVGEKWRCKNPECSTTVKITDALLTEQVTDLMNYAYRKRQQSST
ncbi:zinc ribbon domain-containing protein [Desulfosporosinus sp. BICA1-9]|uniref:zinc ribbon domain-containing protein n=1 Tax=Desulfosporosinus sp. BICA1-9 TaxID=1531958 RepID=UPI000A9885AD|nr:zinc ribbon domain-containing protein [Desulfosporosinus sp. BICA1-9]